MAEQIGATHEEFHHLQEHFDDLAQQRHAGTLGMWAFLATEVLMFGALFVAYGSYRQAYPEAFRQAGSHLFVSIGTINTGVLLTSSFFVAMAAHAAAHQKGRSGNRAIVGWFAAAMALGMVFLILKAVEYYLDWDERLVPWVDFRWAGRGDMQYASQARLFYIFYFIMTAIHALHMVIGIGVLAVVAWFARRGTYSPAYHNPVEVAGLYWHFVDIVWIFLFPTFYLVSTHGH